MRTPPTLCPRTLCLWRPGRLMAGAYCTFAFTGRIP
jgi:hypothetical protein